MRLIAGKVGYTVSCFLAAVLLVVAGYAHKAVADLSALGDGITIGGSSSVGAMNILVMGLESRTDFQGQCLSSGLLTAMHAGNVASCEDQTVGSQDTDTLILVHIFAGGQKAVGFSIPRDDLVTYPKAYYDGITTGKIDQAYYFAYVTSLNSTYGTSMSSTERYLKANQAGQAAEIATVQSVTGVHIDNYAVMNLAGFYTLAQDFGGIEVCVTPTTVNGTADANLYDSRVGLERGRGRLQPEKGRFAVPAPGGRPGARVRQGPGQPARHRPEPHPPAAGGHRLRDLAAEARERVQRPRPADRPARRRQAVADHQLGVQPVRLRHQHERADRQEPEVLHAADLRLRRRRTSTARCRTSTTSTSATSSRS